MNEAYYNLVLLEDDLDPDPDSSPLGDRALFDVLTQNAAILLIILEPLPTLTQIQFLDMEFITIKSIRRFLYSIVDLFCLLDMI